MNYILVDARIKKQQVWTRLGKRSRENRDGRKGGFLFKWSSWLFKQLQPKRYTAFFFLSRLLSPISYLCPCVAYFLFSLFWCVSASVCSGACVSRCVRICLCVHACDAPRFACERCSATITLFFSFYFHHFSIKKKQWGRSLTSLLPKNTRATAAFALFTCTELFQVGGGRLQIGHLAASHLLKSAFCAFFFSIQPVSFDASTEDWKGKTEHEAVAFWFAFYFSFFFKSVCFNVSDS